MLTHTRTGPGTLIAAAALTLALIGGAESVRTQGAEKSIFVSVIDAAGHAVTDMTAADFAVREDGTDGRSSGQRARRHR